MSFLEAKLHLLVAASILLADFIHAQDTATIISDGTAVSTTVISGGVQSADGGVVVPIVPIDDGGPVRASTVQPAASSTITSPPAVPNPAPSNDPNPNPACQQCSIYFQYVSAYYWPTENTNNTACLSGVTDQPVTGLPSGLTPISPSVYLVFPTISAGNACTRVGNIYYDQTMSFAPDALSTIVGTSAVVQPFNFADLPCPPPEVASADSWFYNPSQNPGRAYAPMVSPPPEIFAMDPAFKDCVAAVYQGFDPPYAMPTAQAPSGPGGWGGRKKRALPAWVPHIPAPTPSFTLSGEALEFLDALNTSKHPYILKPVGGPDAPSSWGSGGGWSRRRRAQ